MANDNAFKPEQIKSQLSVAKVHMNTCCLSVDGMGWYEIVYIPDTKRYRADLWGNDNDGYPDYLYQSRYEVLASSPEFASEQTVRDYAKTHWAD